MTKPEVTYEAAPIPPEYGVIIHGVKMNLYDNAAFFYRWVKYVKGAEFAAEFVFPYIRKEWEKAKALNERPNPRKKSGGLVPETAALL